MEGRVALVTGGSRGIGKAISLRLAKARIGLLINYFQNRSEAEKTAEEAAALGTRVRLFQADLKDEPQIENMFRELDSCYGRLDILVHSAASGVLRPVTELTAKQWDWVMNTNVRSLLLCSREAAKRMVEGGRIVALSSIGSSRVVPRYGAIGVSKAALEALTRYLAVELGPRGISVNGISAGAVPTEVWDLVPEGEAALERVRQQTPAGRLLRPEEIAEFVFFLCSSGAQMMQGQVIVVDGGYSLLA